MLAGCDNIATAPQTGRGFSQTAASIEPVDVYIPGYAHWRAYHQGIKILEHPRMRRAIPKGYDGKVTMLTKFSFDGSVKQALFPLRGHDIAISPDKRIGFFGSMEQQTYVAFDPKTLNRVALGRPFKPDWIGGGHAAFLSDDVVAITERAPRIPYTGTPADHYGRVTLREPRSLKIIGDFSTHGIAPHEVRLLDDGVHAAIANYGTTVASAGSSDYGIPRHIVEASVTIVDINSGQLIEKYFGNKREELRHLCVKDRETIFAIQTELIKQGDDEQFLADLDAAHDLDPSNAQGTAFAVAPTVRTAPRSRRLKPVGNRTEQNLMRHGLSIEYDDTHDEVIASYPSTHTVLVFDAATGEVKNRVDCEPIGLRYPCGIALLPGQNYYVVAGCLRNLYVFERGSHKLMRELCHYPLNFGHSHIVAS